MQELAYMWTAGEINFGIIVQTIAPAGQPRDEAALEDLPVTEDVIEDLIRATFAHTDGW